MRERNCAVVRRNYMVEQNTLGKWKEVRRGPDIRESMVPSATK